MCSSLTLASKAVPLDVVALPQRVKTSEINLKYMIHVYPTIAEVLKIVMIAYYKDPSKLACCAE